MKHEAKQEITYSERLRRAKQQISGNIASVKERIKCDEKRLHDLQQELNNVHAAMETSRVKDMEDRVHGMGLGWCFACERLQPQSLLLTYICCHKHHKKMIAYLCLSCRKQIGIAERGVLPIGGLEEYFSTDGEKTRSRDWEEQQYECDRVTAIRGGKAYYLFTNPLATTEESVKLAELEDRRNPPKEILELIQQK